MGLLGPDKVACGFRLPVGHPYEKALNSLQPDIHEAPLPALYAVLFSGIGLSVVRFVHRT